MRVVVFGTRKLGYEGIKKLIDSGHQVVYVVQNAYEITEGYGNFEYAQLVTENNIPFYFGDKLSKYELDKIRDTKPDIGLSLYWRRLLNEEITSIPKYGFLNVHAGKLPRYRGFASSVWQMLKKETTAECCIHQVIPGKADTGNIFAIVKTRINSTTTINDLNNSLFEKAVDILPSVLDKIEKGSTGVPQFEKEAMYSYPRLPQDGLINWSVSSKDIDLLVRALTKPYPGAFTYLNNNGVMEKLYIWKSHPVEHYQFVGIPGHVIKNDKESGESLVLTGDGVLALDEVQHENGKVFQPGKFWNSVQIRLGGDYGDYILNLQERIKKLESQQC